MGFYSNRQENVIESNTFFSNTQNIPNELLLQILMCGISILHGVLSIAKKSNQASNEIRWPRWSWWILTKHKFKILKQNLTDSELDFHSWICIREKYIIL